MDPVDPEWIRELELIDQLVASVESGKQAYEWDQSRGRQSVFLANLSFGSVTPPQEPSVADLDRDDPWCPEENCT